MNFSDIKPFISCGSNSVHIHWGHLEQWIEEQKEDCGLQINPDFQRGHVWSEEKQIAYVEYCLKQGLKANDVYFNCPSWSNAGGDGEMVLVDGLQRITAVRRFLNNEIKAFGYFYNEFEGSLRLTYTRFEVHINELKTRAEVLQWYLDLNEGGVVHTSDELDRVKRLLAEEGNK